MTSPYWIPTDTPGRLAILARPRGGDWLQSDLAEWKRLGIRTLVSMLTEEEVTELDLASEVAQWGSFESQFIAVPVGDRGLPDDGEWFSDMVVEIVSNLEAGRGVGIHCRLGIGRSPLLAIAVLIALGVPTPDAIQRASAARGRPVPETPEQREWISRYQSPALATAGSA